MATEGLRQELEEKDTEMLAAMARANGFDNRTWKRQDLLDFLLGLADKPLPDQAKTEVPDGE